MSLSEIEKPPASDIEGKLDALHEEVCYMRGQWPRLEAMVTEMHSALAALEEFRPLLERYAAATRSPAARWTRRRNGAEADMNHLPGGVVIDG